MRDVKFVRLDFVNCEIFCETAPGRTKLESGPMSVGRVSFVVACFFIASGAFCCDCDEDDPGIGILVAQPLIGIRD